MNYTLRIALRLAHAIVLILSSMSLIVMLILSRESPQGELAAAFFNTMRRVFVSGALLSMLLLAAQMALPPLPSDCEKGTTYRVKPLLCSLWVAIILQVILCSTVAWPLIPYMPSDIYIKIQLLSLTLYIRSSVA
ncbi:hypothetical protein DSO57_1025061 [Entomophthora muscae]|uniref:Uncharacterized protein n=2 Tax=Entomophthora muscae TaxID=34485 RepID=A0ACC2TPH0_9FUNG|nr:hypothetical protein DSO57_1033535 [Entomophthora muscae]KAJ9076549.1 hypothetical protein DSO57_1025061 [Entomophthora muscae]